MVLTTKLFRPKPPPTHLRRQRLVDRLEEGGHSDLTLVAAPAGYGKTTVVAAWLADKPATDSCWISLDERDNDPRQFWQYMVAGLRSISAEVGAAAEQALTLIQAEQIDSVVLSLINDIWQAYQTHGQQWVLVLDDYHLIHTPQIHDSLDLFIEQLPVDALRVVLTTRSDPPLNLARRRARQQLCELRAADLRFNRTEIDSLLNQQLGLQLSAEAVDHLAQRTEGWIAALQLTALSLRGSENRQAFVTSLAHNNRFVADYLVAEVVGNLPDDVQQFLSKTACLKQLSAELVTHLLPNLNAADILRQLETDNLFLVPLDAARTQFRYHHLFADLLQQVNAPDSAESAALLHAASLWHAAQEEWPLAIDYAQQISAHDLVAQHLINLATPEPHHEDLRLDWFDSLPDAQFIATPGLHVLRTLILIYMPSAETSERAVRDLVLARERFGDLDRIDPFWHAQILLYEVVVAMLQPPIDSVTSVARVEKATQLLADSYPFLHARALYQSGWTYLAAQESDKARTCLEQALTLSQQTNDPFIAMQAQSALWSFDSTLGQASSARLREVDQFIATSPLVKRHYPLTATAYRVRGLTLHGMGQPEAAIEALMRARDLIVLTSEYGQEFIIRWNLALALGSVGRVNEALEMAHSIGERAPLFASFGQFLERWLTQWQYGEDALISAEFDRWITAEQDTLLNYEATVLQSMQDIVVVLSLVICGRLHMREQALDQLPTIVDKLTACISLVNTQNAPMKLPLLINLAIFHDALDQGDRAMATLREAVALAQPFELRAQFSEPRTLLLPLLDRLSKLDGATPWLDSLIATNRELVALRRGQPTTKSAPPAQQPVDALTDRELEILALIADGLTNKQIAERLYLSPNTVRVHTSNIYGKLAVPNRTQAASKARTLGLVP